MNSLESAASDENRVPSSPGRRNPMTEILIIAMNKLRRVLDNVPSIIEATKDSRERRRHYKNLEEKAPYVAWELVKGEKHIFATVRSVRSGMDALFLLDHIRKWYNKAPHIFPDLPPRNFNNEFVVWTESCGTKDIRIVIKRREPPDENESNVQPDEPLLHTL